MSSINPTYTFQYSQPAEYHFSHDSVFFAQFVTNWIKKNPEVKINQITDLCAGCGIIGMDLLFHLHQNQLQMPAAIDFIEIQNIYNKHFETNKIEFRKNVQTEIEMNFVCANYAEICDDLKFKSKYDLIICNPPYFKLGQGKLSSSNFKNRCRFFMDSDFLNLIKFIKYALSKNGRAFLLLRSLVNHNDDWGLDQLATQFNLKFEMIGDIRGTDVLMAQNV